MGHLYAGLAEFKAFLSGGDVGEDRDSTMLIVLESSSRAVDSFCHRAEGFAAELADLVPACALTWAADDDDTDLLVDDASGILVNQTLAIEDEEVLVIAVDVDSATLTVIRGQRGTTPAIHADTTALSAFRYPSQVVDTTLRVAQRRWRSRDAGVTGMYGGGDVPQTGNQDTEFAIMRAGLGRLRLAVVS